MITLIFNNSNYLYFSSLLYQLFHSTGMNYNNLITSVLSRIFFDSLLI